MSGNGSAPQRERRAYVCANVKGHEGEVPLRMFMLPGDTAIPRCPIHNRPMERQPNRRYGGGR